MGRARLCYIVLLGFLFSTQTASQSGDITVGKSATTQNGVDLGDTGSEANTKSKGNTETKLPDVTIYPKMGARRIIIYPGLGAPSITIYPLKNLGGGHSTIIESAQGSSGISRTRCVYPLPVQMRSSNSFRCVYLLPSTKVESGSGTTVEQGENSGIVNSGIRLVNPAPSIIKESGSGSVLKQTNDNVLTNAGFRFIYPLKVFASGSSTPIIYPLKNKAGGHRTIIEEVGSNSVSNGNFLLTSPLKVSSSEGSNRFIYGLPNKDAGYKITIEKVESNSNVNGFLIPSLLKERTVRTIYPSTNREVAYSTKVQQPETSNAMIKDFRFVYPLKPSSSRSSVPVIYPFRSKATVYTSIGAGSDSAVNKKLQVIDPLKASNSKQSKQVIYTLLDKSNGYRTAMKQAERRSGAKAVKASRVATPSKDSYAGDSDKKVYSLKNKSIPGIAKHRNNGKKDKVYRLTTFLRGSDIIRLFGGNQSKVTAVHDGTSTLN